MLRMALDELKSEESPTSYQVVYLRVVEGRSVEEVSAATGLSRDQVRARHHRMMNRVRKTINLFTGKPFHDGVNCKSNA